jgi:integrase/recombinase XerD
VTASRPRTKAPKDQQLKGELRGDLGAYEKIGLFQRDISKNTAYRYRGALLRYQEFLGDNPPTLDATYQFLSSLRQHEFDPSTLRVYAVALSNYHQWRGEELNFKVKVPKRVPKQVPEEPVVKMLELSKDKPHDELILRLMADAGMRRDETVNVTAGAVENNCLKFIGKGDKERRVPMTRRLAELVAVFAAGKSPAARLVGVGEKGIYGLVKRYAAAAGFPELTPHDLRRYFGARIQEITGDIRITQELLGHADVNTTQIYTAVKPKRLEEAIARLNDTTLDQREKLSEPENINTSRVSAELSTFSVIFGDNTLTASGFLTHLWNKLCTGLTTAQCVESIAAEDKFRESDPKLIWEGVETLLARLNLNQIVVRELRRSGTTIRSKIDIGYWVLTDFGKRMVLELEHKQRP